MSDPLSAPPPHAATTATGTSAKWAEEDVAMAGDLLVLQRSYLLSMKRGTWDGGMVVLPEPFLHPLSPAALSLTGTWDGGHLAVTRQVCILD